MNSSPRDHEERVQMLFLRYSDVIRGFIRGLLPDRVRADDVLQETFITIVRKAADFDPQSNFPKWACSIARYKVMEEKRSMGKACGMLSPEAMEALAVSEEAFSRDPRLDQLQHCIKGLPGGMQRLIRLRYQEDHTPAEVAERLGWTPASVYVALSRIRSQLKECISSSDLTPFRNTGR